MYVSLKIWRKSQETETRFSRWKSNDFNNIISSCHWKTLVPFCLQKERPENTFLKQYQYYPIYTIKNNCKASLEKMLVCCCLGLFFFEYIRLVGKKIFLSFWDGKDSFNPYLINLILEFFAPLHLVCLLLRCACIIMNLAYFNQQNSQLGGWKLHGTLFPWLCLHPSPWMGWWYKHSLER